MWLAPEGVKRRTPELRRIDDRDGRLGRDAIAEHPASRPVYDVYRRHRPASGEIQTRD